MQILEWLRLDIFVSLAAVITIITQLIKAAPVAITSNYPKMVAWIVTSILIGAIGYIEKADISTILTIGAAVGLAANGLYDVVSGPVTKMLNWAKK